MPESQCKVPGNFTWFELGTTDQAAAKRFYGSLFGWTANDFPMGPDAFYTMFQLNGRDVGGAYTMMPDQVAQGVPPHWATYVAVTSADEKSQQATSLGATVLVPPFDVYDFGRMSVLRDPTGATISIWQPKQHQGSGAHSELNAFCWSELMTRDTAAARRFYTGLFGWTTKETAGTGAGYTHWQNNGTDIGGMLDMPPNMGPAPPHWINYVQVADCDGTASQAEKLGGKVFCPPLDIPNTGRFCVLADPQGAAFAVIKLLPMTK